MCELIMEDKPSARQRIINAYLDTLKTGSSRKLGGLNAMRDSSNIYSTFRLTTSLGRYGFIQAPAGG